jgi:hypothetical protein
MAAVSRQLTFLVSIGLAGGMTVSSEAQAARIKSSTSNVDQLKGAPMTTVQLQITALNVRVDDQPFARYSIALASSFDGGAEPRPQRDRQRQPPLVEDVDADS